MNRINKVAGYRRKKLSKKGGSIVKINSVTVKKRKNLSKKSKKLKLKKLKKSNK